MDVGLGRLDHRSVRDGEIHLYRPGSYRGLWSDVSDAPGIFKLSSSQGVCRLGIDAIFCFRVWIWLMT
jgi:hypothetical protein